MTAADTSVARVMAALHAHLPLTLLVDLMLVDPARAALADTTPDRSRDDPQCAPIAPGPTDLSSGHGWTGPAP